MAETHLGISSKRHVLAIAFKKEFDMNCEQAKLVLLDYLMEETSTEERGEIGRHLKS